jgi:hypothetical protein
MSGEIVEPELLELPAEFEALPYALRARALAWARAAVPAQISGQLGAAVYDDTLANAAAHWLESTDQPGLEDVEEERPRARKPIVGSSPARNWAGSIYGEAVAATLDRLPRSSGRGRRALQVMPP